MKSNPYTNCQLLDSGLGERESERLGVRVCACVCVGVRESVCEREAPSQPAGGPSSHPWVRWLDSSSRWTALVPCYSNIESLLQ